MLFKLILPLTGLISIFLLYRFFFRKYIRIEVFERFDALKAAVLDESLALVVTFLMFVMVVLRGFRRVLHGDEDFYIRETARLSGDMFRTSPELSNPEFIRITFFGDEEKYIRTLKAMSGPKNSGRSRHPVGELMRKYVYPV